MRFEKSADTKVIESVLIEAKVGQLVTYEKLSEAIGRDVREYARGSLQTARSTLLKDNQIVFAVENKVGLKRLDDSQIIASTESDRLHIQRTGKKVLNKLSTVKFEGLTESEKKQHIVASAQVGAIVMFSQKSSQKKIESKVQHTAGVLAIGETLKMFT